MNSKTIATFLFAVLSVTASAQEAQQDFTSKIVNPGFEQDLSIGWISRGMGRMDNTEANAGKKGTFYCERWTQPPGHLPTTTLEQTISEVPNGDYRVTAICHAENQSGTPAVVKGVYLCAGSHETEVTALDVYSVDVTVTRGTLTIGFRTQSTDANWATVDDYHLYYLGESAEGYRQALAESVEQLTALLADKDILPDDLRAEAQATLEASQSAETVEQLLAAAEAVNAAYDQCKSYRLPVTYDDPEVGYLFIYFPSNDDENIYYAYSEDGFNYTPLNEGKMVLRSDSVALTRGMRDPHILRGVDGKTFYMVATDMHTPEGWSIGNKGIVLLKSTDLIHWEHATVNFSTRFGSVWKNVVRVWAPEVIWDPNYDNKDGSFGRYLVYFSLLTNDGKVTYDKIYYCYINDDFTNTKSSPKIFFDRGASTIDGDIVFDPSDQLYHMIYKNEDDGGISQVTAKRLIPEKGQPDGSQWSAPLGTVQQTGVAVEGGGMFRLIDSDTWVVMYDCYQSGYYQFCSTKDWEHFQLEAQTMTSGAFTPRHGTVITLKAKEIEALLKAFPTKGIEFDGIESTAKDDQPVRTEYFTLQGVRVENPRQGVTISRQTMSDGRQLSKKFISK
ncbi:MAG: glycoside hydrolase family 43 protein [Bacteroidaceae bacterium]|nr:glycoside hydrolase family 43 protein [Bacteroidaceae bacterium]